VGEPTGGEPPLGQGVFYVATESDRFLVEASRSAESLRRWMPDVHVTLFTDRPGRVPPDVFDGVEVLPFGDALGTSWGSGLLGKVRAFVRAPYQKSLYLDTDTRVLSPRIRELFDELDRYEMAIAPCEPGESRGQSLSGRPMFNSGVIAFRRTERVMSLLAAWLARHEEQARAVRAPVAEGPDDVRHLRGVERLYQLVADQTSLARFLAPDVNEFQIRYLTLPRIWNWRRNRIDDAHAADVVIHHAEKYKVSRD
jgi:hypothetical protein